MDIWKGAFSPVLRKHRDYCGDINNHIEIIGQEIIDVSPEDGVMLVLVKVGFADTEESVYEYEVEMEIDGDLSDDILKEEVVKQIRSKGVNSVQL